MIWFSDFFPYLKEGGYYCPENNISSKSVNHNDFNIPQAKVVELSYGIENKKL